jgi:transcriptional regulator with PAS, ATPase and Fis domain
MGIKGTAQYTFEDIIGCSEKLKSCKEKAFKASKTSSPVLIFGETGTGKELFVQAIHNSSNRSKNTFIAQNCSAIPYNLLESIFFGTVSGSFTGAENRKGLFELANEGTLYMDELNSMSMELQGKILRVLQEGTIRRVGSTIVKEVNVRVIASLNEVPEFLIETGRLRSDLYYRLNVVRIDIPPLRERKEDISELIHYFIGKFNKSFKAAIIGIDELAMERLILNDWEGNIRELEHIIEGIFNLKLQGCITLKDLEDVGFKHCKELKSLKDRLKEVEKAYIIEALTITQNNVTKAAEFLKIPRQTLQSRMKRLNIR